MSDVSRFEGALRERAGATCELCGGDASLQVLAVPPSPEPSIERCLLICEVCEQQRAGNAPLDSKHWFCLQSAAWSEVPAVQVLSWRLLHRLTDEAWAQDLIGQLYLDEPTLEWARAGLAGDTMAPTLDSNGTPLSDGDSVTLIKDLEVKGAGFTAKRGTLVKNIRLTDDPGNVEGRVSKVAIVLKTEFLKKA